MTARVAPVNIVVYGALRSGTTLLRLMLDAHPDIGCPGERDFIFDHLESGSGQYRLDKAALQEDWIFRTSGLSVPKATDGDRVFAEMCAEDAAGHGKRTHVLMLHRRLDRLLDIRPDIKIVHILRDPRDVARSSIGMGWAGNTWYGVDHWIETEAGWAKQKHRMAEGQVFDLHYEKLLEDPEGLLRALCGFLGLQYSPQMFSYSETSTYDRIDPALAYQWKRRQAPRDIAEVDYKLGDLLKASGYEPGPLPARKPGSLRRLVLKINNKRHTLKTTFERYGYVDPIVLRVTGRLGLESVRREAMRRIDAKRRNYLK